MIGELRAVSPRTTCITGQTSFDAFVSDKDNVTYILPTDEGNEDPHSDDRVASIYMNYMLDAENAAQASTVDENDLRQDNLNLFYEKQEIERSEGDTVLEMHRKTIEETAPILKSIFKMPYLEHVTLAVAVRSFNKGEGSPTTESDIIYKKFALSMKNYLTDVDHVYPPRGVHRDVYRTREEYNESVNDMRLQIIYNISPIFADFRTLSYKGRRWVEHNIEHLNGCRPRTGFDLSYINKKVHVRQWGVL